MMEEEIKDSSLKFTIFQHEEKSIDNLQYKDDFSSLPNEIVVMIFKYLPLVDLKKCGTVSEKWRALSFNPILWNKFYLSEANIQVNVLEKILNCGVKTLMLSKVHVISQTSPDSHFFGTVKFSSLKYLDIYKSLIQNELLEELVALSPQLQVIKLVCPHNALKSSMIQLILNLKLLKKLHCYLSNISDIDNAIAILRGSENLITLTSLEIGLQYPSIWLSTLYGNFLVALLKLCPALQDLAVMGSFSTDDVILKYIFKMKNLRKLTVRNCEIYSPPYSEILNNIENYEILKNLQELTLFSSGIKDEVLILLLELSPFLTSLELINYSITFTIFEKFMNLKWLKKLRLIICPLSNSFILNDLEYIAVLRELHFAQVEPRLKSTQLLKGLLRDPINFHRLEIINFDLDEIFGLILEMNNLEYLALSAVNSNLGHETSFSLKNYEAFSKLKELKLNYRIYCEFPVGAEIILLLSPNLSFLNLSNCHITDRIWKVIASLKLNSLVLDCVEDSLFCKIFTNEGGGQGFDNLQHLCITYVDIEYNPFGLERLLMLCADTLTDLNLKNVFLTETIYNCIFSMKELSILSLSSVLGTSTNKISEVLNKCQKLNKKNLQIR